MTFYSAYIISTPYYESVSVLTISRFFFKDFVAVLISETQKVYDRYKELDLLIDALKTANTIDEIRAIFDAHCIDIHVNASSLEDSGFEFTVHL